MTQPETDSSLRAKIGYLETRNAYEHHDLTSQIEVLQIQVERLEAELANRPVVYIAKLPSGDRFMPLNEPQVFLSIENAKNWFATVPIHDVEFEPYKGEQ